MNKKTWVILVGIILIVAGGLFLYYLNTKQSKQKPVEFTTKQLNKSETPVGFEGNLPVEAGSKVLQNYETRTSDGRLQSTKEVTSAKDPMAALNFYIDFFKESGWIGGYSEGASVDGVQELAQMQKDQNMLMIVARPDGSNQSKVELTMIQRVQ